MLRYLLECPGIATTGHWRYAQITDYTPASEDERASDASPSRSLLPVEFYLGTRPIQADRSRPDLKAWGLGMEATDNARAQALGCKKTQQKRPDTAPINRRAWSMRPGGLSASI